MADIEPGFVLLVNYGDGIGREQSGQRPVVVVSSIDHLDIADQLVTVIPCTTVMRGWPNHVRLTGPIGLSQPTVAITEQIRTIDRSRLLRITGTVDQRCLNEICLWLEDWKVARSA
jgi:mRNA interferase MazF